MIQALYIWKKKKINHVTSNLKSKTYIYNVIQLEFPIKPITHFLCHSCLSHFAQYVQVKRGGKPHPSTIALFNPSRSGKR